MTLQAPMHFTDFSARWIHCRLDDFSCRDTRNFWRAFTFADCVLIWWQVADFFGEHLLSAAIQFQRQVTSAMNALAQAPWPPTCPGAYAVMLTATQLHTNGVWSNLIANNMGRGFLPCRLASWRSNSPGNLRPAWSAASMVKAAVHLSVGHQLLPLLYEIAGLWSWRVVLCDCISTWGGVLEYHTQMVQVPLVNSDGAGTPGERSSLTMPLVKIKDFWVRIGLCMHIPIIVQPPVMMACGVL